MASHEVTLTVNGTTYGGWKTIRITLNMENLSGVFELGISEKWPGQNISRGIQYGDECVLRIGSEVILTGYVDQVNIDYDAEQHSILVSGRDKAGDLIDSSALNKPGTWSGRNLLQIANDLSAPFGIPIHSDVSLGKPFKTFAIEPGESVYEALERLAKMRAVLIISDGHGGLLITRAGHKTASTALHVGENIQACNATFDYTNRFSQIMVKGQSQGDDLTPASIFTGARSVANDPEVKRYRPLLVMAESQVNTQQCKERAAWEVAVRKGKSTNITYTVPAWRQVNGALWQINTLVFVSDTVLKLRETMLISGVQFQVDDQGGSLTMLTVTKPDAFKLIEEPETV
jgi:prophage tail gpP-like protein